MNLGRRDLQRGHQHLRVKQYLRYEHDDIHVQTGKARRERHTWAGFSLLASASYYFRRHRDLFSDVRVHDSDSIGGPMFSFAWRLKPTLAYGFSVLGDRWSTLNMTDKEVSMHTGRSGLKETHENARFTLQHWRLFKYFAQWQFLCSGLWAVTFTFCGPFAAGINVG